MSSKADRRRERRAEIREFKARLENLEVEELRSVQHEQGRIHAGIVIEVGQSKAKLEAIRLELKRRETSTDAGFHISDHAVLRYLERVHRVDMKAIREEIATLAASASTGEKVNGVRHKRTDLVTDDNVVIGISERNVITTILTPAEEDLIGP